MTTPLMSKSGMADEPQWEGDTPLTDDEVRELGFEPTPRGWTILPKRYKALIERACLRFELGDRASRPLLGDAWWDSTAPALFQEFAQ